MTARKRLSPETIEGVKADIADDLPVYRIMARWGVTRQTVKWYSGYRKGAYGVTREPMRERAHISARPHMMPWLTVEMLTAGRARPAKVMA